MHGFHKNKRSPIEGAHRQLLRERSDDRHLLQRAGPVVTETGTDTASRHIITTTVVVKVPPTTSAAAKVTTTPAVKPTTSAAPKAVSTTSSSTPSTTSTTSSAPATTAKPTTSATPSVTPTTHSSSTTPPTSSAARALTSSLSSLSAAPTVSDSASNNTVTPARTGGLSAAATGGIVAACVLASLALLIFAIRKTFIQRRKRKRTTWGAGMYPAYSDKDGGFDDLPPPLPEKVVTPTTSTSFGVGAATPRTPVWAPPRPESIVNSPLSAVQAPVTIPAPAKPVAATPPVYISPPPMSYNNPIVDDVYGGIASGAAATSGTTSPTPRAAPASAAAQDTAVVRVVYIPSLPDELSITAGEVVRVLKAFDDGWALCANARGEQGVVPLECLDRSAALVPTVGYGQHENASSDWRSARRISSLSTQQPHY